MKKALLLFVFAALTTVGYTNDNTDTWEQKVEAEVEAVESEIESIGEKIASEAEAAAEHIHK